MTVITSCWTPEIIFDFRFIILTMLVGLLLAWFVAGSDIQKGLFRGKHHSNLIREGSMQWWDELAPPFAMESSMRPNDPLDHDNDDDNDEEPDVTHFCFLVHGHRGLSKDLSYLQAVMESFAERQRKRRHSDGHSRHDMVVHSSVCNERRTTDGVAKGGQRLTVEMLATIREEMDKRQRPLTVEDDEEMRDVTISVVGNSLGGIYGRYAIAQLAELCGGELIMDGMYRLHFNIFCTTATPHLGVSKYTYVPLPRSAEIGVAHAMGCTGKDLFRLNDLMKDMATSSKFLNPLGAFRKRIAYANAYGTDFPVPAGTAAFLSDQSRYPHHFTEDRDEVDTYDRVLIDDESSFVIATLHTRQSDGDGEELLGNDESKDELVIMSTSLDALGWKKVFVDIRTEIPIGVNIPRLRRKNSNTDDSCNMLEADAPLDILRQKGIVESRDVATAVKLAPNNGDKNRLSLPMGHNMIVAFSRSRISTLMNKGGRPVVDALAKELVEDIFAWNRQEQAIQ